MALAAAQAFLLAQQDGDGFWRDYDLEPGQSEAWTTACVGHALLRAPGAVESGNDALRRAADAVRAARGPVGWGYNRRTAADADSSAWAIRFLTASGDVTGLRADDLLGPFVAPSGRACTFRPPERFGRWAEEHDEVTPMVGLAYLAAGARDAVVTPLRCATIETHVREACWRSFWWATPAYAAAINLEFLAASGGIPDVIAEAERARLRSRAADSPFEGIQCLAAASHLRASDQADRFLDGVLSQRLDDGSWPASRVLRVPRQRDADTCTLHGDDRRLFGTAQALAAIKRWLGVVRA